MRHTTTGVWAERWHYSLSYDEDDAGPGFHLAAVQQTFPSGSAPPPTHFDYFTADEALAATNFQPVPALDVPIAMFGEDVIQPTHTTALDLNLDGRPDLEDHLRGTLLVQQGSSFLSEELPPRTPTTVDDCRPVESIYNPPRQLAQMWAASDAHQVVVVRSDGPFANTDVTVCDRKGDLLGSQSVESGWGLGANTRLVDLNRDRQPDLLRVYAGGYEILPNTSTETTFSLGGVHSGVLAPIFTPDTTWVHDINGDGLADLISRFDGGLVVWYGKGRFDFDPNGQVFPVHLWIGWDLTNLLDYELTFADVNRDGLTDLVATQAGFSGFFLNTGTDFTETSFPAQSFFDGSSSPVVVSDFSGNGGTQLTTVKQGHAYAATLDAPGTGLLRSADDGKGTVLHLSYQWSAPTVGSRQRQAVLSDVTLESSGNDAVHSTYSYGEPVLHPDGRFLLGYSSVARTDPATTEEVTFLHDKNQAGLVLGSTAKDPRMPGVWQYAQRSYDSVVFRGVPWKRLNLERNGWASATTSIEEGTEFIAYDAGICPSLTVHHTAQGSLTTEHHRAVLAGLSEHLHCLDAREVMIGAHANAGFDFRHEARLTRNAVGLLTKQESVSPTGDLTLQDLVYRSDLSLDHVSAPGSGATYFEFELDNSLLRKITTSEGTVVAVTGRDPLTDAVRALATSHGPTSYTQSFRYDGLERLTKQWDSLGAATEINPAQLLAYKYATAVGPAAVHVTTLVLAQTASVRQAVEWSTAAGEAVTTAQRIPQGWSFGTLSQFSRNLLETRGYTRPSEPATLVPDTLTHAQLNAGAQLVSTVRSAGFGHSTDALTKLHANVEQEISTNLKLVPGALEYASLENGVNGTLRWLDTSKHVLMSEDQAKTRHYFEYDALDRLRSVILPDSSRHAVTYDDHGRIFQVEREGLATIKYGYDAQTGLLHSQQFLSPAGVAQRALELTYDTIGRKTLEVHTDLATGDTQHYSFFYDGATPSAPSQLTHLGVLSAVVGDGYQKTFEYRADDKLLKSALKLNGWRTVERTLAYADDDEVSAQATSVRDTNGVLLSTSTTQNQWDGYGRLSGILLNGVGLVTIGYDANGLLSSGTFASGGTVSLGYDPLTRTRTSVTQATPAWSASTVLHLNTRGFPDNESYVVGGKQLQREYTYSPQGFLSGATDAENAYAYEFDASGLPTAIQEQGVRTSLDVQGNTLTAGAVVYAFDDLGRTISKGDLSLSYGPTGHLAGAVRGNNAWTFLYDEAGQRLLKLKNGTPVAAYLEGGTFLDSSGLVEPLRFAGQLVGVVQAGGFQMLASDARGTRVADLDGTARLASPFGKRTVHADGAAVLDYVEKGFDADLGLIRMGVRDYDPALNRFLTPDPLFFAEPQRCIDAPLACNLYAYANGNPLRYLDSTGLAPTDPWYVRVGKVASGIAYGTVQAVTPGGVLADLVAQPSDDSDVRAGKAIGGGATGIVQIVGGVAAITGAGVSTGGTGGAALATGVPEVALVAGLAGVSRGLANVGAAVNTLMSKGSGVGSAGSAGSAGPVGTAAPQLSTAAQRSIRSISRELAEHEEKLAAYKENPFAFDNQGHLARNAGRPEIQQQIIDSRVRHLESEIANFKNQLGGLSSGKVEP